jgi:hypothetical protein
MNCQKFESFATELARGQMMEADLLVDARAHAAQCATCSSQLRNEEMLTLGLRTLTTAMNSVEVPANIESRLIDAFRKSSIGVPQARSHRRYWLTAIAAMLLIAFGLVAMVWRNSNLPQKELVKTPAAPKTPVNVKREETVRSEEQTAEVNNVHHQRKTRPSIKATALQARNNGRQNSNERAANHVVNEVATDFMPLGYLNPASLQDGGQIVRVEVPRTTLANFGFPVNMDRYNERVKADVLLGVDGVAHAIRFVQEKRSQ